MLKRILLSSILVNNRVIATETRQKFFQLQLSAFENFQLELQENCVIKYNFVNYNYNFSKPGSGYRDYRISEMCTSLKL